MARTWWWTIPWIWLEVTSIHSCIYDWIFSVRTSGRIFGINFHIDMHIYKYMYIYIMQQCAHTHYSSHSLDTSFCTDSVIYINTNIKVGTFSHEVPHNYYYYYYYSMLQNAIIQNRTPEMVIGEHCCLR
jgi:hypothetical protein